jgi:transcriptional regulator with XRE-family HTH domain
MAGKRATATDVLVGQRVQTFRKAAGLSQTDLANEIGVTFQQVQKYENGSNRVAAGRLTQIAKALDIPLTAFFDGTAQSTKRRAPDTSLHELMAEPRAYKLLGAFCQMPDSMQVAVLQFVRSVRTPKPRRKK